MMYFKMLIYIMKENSNDSYKTKNGKWVVDISDGFSPLTGKRIRHRKKGFKTRKEAEDYEAN